VSSYEISVCDLSRCTQEVKTSERIAKNWVVIEGRLWAFNHDQSPSLDLAFCSWEHFTEAAKRNFK
jgi:hypothetical protein